MSMHKRAAELADELASADAASRPADPFLFFSRNDALPTILLALRALAAQEPQPVANVQAMVDRFLGWPLPPDFAPDCYITFDRELCRKNKGQPIGTNLLTADQARAMFEHCLAAPPRASQTVEPVAQPDRAVWLLESAPVYGMGPHWYTGSKLSWTKDANEAMWFARKQDAERMRDDWIDQAGVRGVHATEAAYTVTEHVFASPPAEPVVPKIVGYMVHGDDITHAALYPIARARDAHDAAKRWGKAITALVVHPHAPEIAAAPPQAAARPSSMDYGMGEPPPDEAAAQPQDERVALTAAAQDVLAERERQISAEGWTTEHDDEHSRGELAKAAACYSCRRLLFDAGGMAMWPSDWQFKQDAPRRMLVKAGALILAEIERLDRAALGKGKGQK